MASAQSSAFRSPAGYAANKPVQAAFPAPTMGIPGLPTVPAIDDARAPNATGRSWLQTLLTNLPGKYNPALGAARDNARANLAGYGGVTFRDDDPNTAEREDLLPGFDPNAPLGQREKNAVNAERNAANSQGMLESSFANQAIGGALTRLNEEKRAIVANFASQINSVISAQASEATSHIRDWVGLYGEDSRWLVDNPPPTPPPPPPHPGDPAGWTPAQMAAAPPEQNMTYSDFLRGRKSTKALAMQWDAKFNRNRRFGGA